MIYTVHVPRDGFDPVAAAERARFIRDGFSWGAFVFGPFWFIRHGSVIGLAINLTLLGGAFALQRFAGLNQAVLPGLTLLVALFIGFEATSLLRWSTDRRRFSCVDVVSAGNLEEAETHFLRRWASRPSMAPLVRTGLAPAYAPMGLFSDEANG